MGGGSGEVVVAECARFTRSGFLCKLPETHVLLTDRVQRTTNQQRVVIIFVLCFLLKIRLKTLIQPFH